jgi:DNA-binding transcriptional LysR family regulator
MAAAPDWVTIKIVLAAIDTGSVTRAANRCGIATSAAAKRIQVLEADHGVSLLDRTARGVRSTPAGEVFARHGRAMLDLAARLSDDLAALAAGGLGSVRLHATASLLAGPELAEALAGFAAAHPGIDIALREATSLAILQDLQDGRTDLGLITTAARIPVGLDARVWRRDRLLVVVHGRHGLAGRDSVTYAEALDYPMVGVLEASAITLLLEKEAQELGRRARFKFRVESTDVARRLVAAGHGVSIMPDGVLHGYEAALNLRGVPLSDAWSFRDLRLVSRAGDVLTPPARLLRDTLLASSVGSAFANAGR